MSKHNYTSLAVTVANVNIMRNAVNYNGYMVINSKVTDKVMKCLTMSTEEIATPEKAE